VLSPSARNIRLLTFIAELNDLEVWATDIGNAYLESYTQEKVYIIAGPEFGDRQGHTLVIRKALYGLKSSGIPWHEPLSDVLRDMGFIPSKAKHHIWMRDCGDHYEHIAVYVDDLLIASKDPSSIIKTLSDEHMFKLKGTSVVSFHLGCDWFHNGDGNLCYTPHQHVEKVMDNYLHLFGKRPHNAHSPIVQGNHPELDTSDLLDDANIQICQSLIGSLQWAIQIGRFYIATVVMTLLGFRACPRRGHLDRVERVIGYLSKFKHCVIRIHTDKPDYSKIPKKEYDWFYTCYAGAREGIPEDCPTPRGNSVVTTTYVDANLFHDMISGRSVAGILHLLNMTPVDWCSKLQSTVETAVFGSEHVAARTATEQILDLRLTVRYLGVPLDGPSFMFGDNESVVNTASVPHSKLHKRHNALSCHRTREAIAAGITRFHHIVGTANPADILSKDWGHSSIWETIHPLLFW